MIDVAKLLYEISDDRAVFDKDIDLIESGILDSYVIIELFSKFEELGLDIQLTRINREKLRTVKGIEDLISEYLECKC